ncbi:LysR family transcriptional regulator [Chitinasiproducens palmae]|uniref:DNA-binding transcriptional regulator, LysR family n=1 Tax=Chitinasiproducens palmae TaxID=1770053 RepID=A0A1H2PW21_9BURK|nr:LysR family transcriptional regulator [Chitinasiproducens palmae]SDV51541.1 DNA-binding transcriptional regulator, LysR family [Chitinasiproducens palmae]
MPPDKPDEGANLASPVTLRFDLVELETFLAVVEFGSFSAAAKRLHISQPSVTARVQRLESMLKTRLLTRTTRHVEPTPAGVRLRERAELALRDLRKLLQEFQGEAEAARSRVVVAATPMIAAVMLPSLIHGFCQRHPDVQVQLRDLQYEAVVTAIESGEADLAVVAFDNDSSKLSFEALTEEDMLVVVPRSHALAEAGAATLEQLAQLPLMLLDRYSMLRDTLASEFDRRGLILRPMHRAANLSTLLGMVDAGLGATFLPRSMAHRYARDTRATLQVADVGLTRSFGILRSRDTPPSAAALGFARHLQANFGAVVASGAPTR